MDGKSNFLYNYSNGKLLLLYFLSEGKDIFFNFLRKCLVMTESWKYDILVWVTE